MKKKNKSATSWNVRRRRFYCIEYVCTPIISGSCGDGDFDDQDDLLTKQIHLDALDDGHLLTVFSDSNVIVDRGSTCKLLEVLAVLRPGAVLTSAEPPLLQ